MTLTDWWQCPRCPGVSLGGRCDRCGCERPHTIRVTLSPAEARLLAAGNVGPAATAAAVADTTRVRP